MFWPSDDSTTRAEEGSSELTTGTRNWMNFKSRQEKAPGCGSLDVYTRNNISYWLVSRIKS